MENDTMAQKSVGTKLASGDGEVKFCREYWTGDSRDGQYTNGDGYHYFQMTQDGAVIDAYEYYETDDGEEHSARLGEFIGINWFDYFGFEDDELLEEVARHEFEMIKDLSAPDDKSSPSPR
jgi:hypothetical protein